MTTIRIKLPTIDQVEFTIEAEEETISVRGNAIASGDTALDKKVEDEIFRKLEYTQWAWCCVCVTAKWKGLKGTDYLGGCSYDDEEDFIKTSGYFDGMKQQAFNNLIDQIKALK